MFILAPEAVMQIKIKKIILGTLILLALPVFGFADEDFNPGSYLFFLYYDQGQLFANRDFASPYDVTTKKYQEGNSGNGYFRGRVVSAKGAVLADFKFDPQKGDASFKKGAILVDAPYFFNAKEVKFYNNRGDQLLAISVAGQSFCNEDGVCDKNAGEDTRTCPTDCGAVSVVAPSFTPSLRAPSISSPIPLSTQTQTSFFSDWRVLAGGGVAILGLIGWVLIRWLKKKKNDLPPPQI